MEEIVESEMDVRLDQVSQTSVTELNPVTITPISTQDVSKPDGTAAMMQLLLNKFDEQSVKFDEKFTNLNDKFDKQSVRFDNFDKQFNEQKNEIKNSFEVNCDELKNEIKNRNTNLIKQCDIVISKLDDQLIQIENQKVNSIENSTKNKVLINKVNNSDNCLLYTSRCV